MAARPYTVLMTCIGGELAVQSVLHLKASTRHKVRVVGVDATATVGGRRFVDAFACVPRGSAPDYIDRMVDVIHAERVDLLIPGSDEEAVALVAQRHKIESTGCILACAEESTVRTLSSKSTTYQWLDDHGVPTPRWTLARTVDEVRTAVDALVRERGDAVVKPAGSRGGRGAIIIRPDVKGVIQYSYTGSRETHADPQSFVRDILPTYGEFLPAIVMQRLRGVSCDLDLLGWRGQAVRIVPRKRINPVRPYEGNQMLDSPALFALGKRLVEVFKLSWLYDCDAMFDENGQPFVVEINPRPSGSISMPMTAGIPLLDELLSLAKGEPVPPPGPFPAGVVVASYTGLSAVQAD